MSVFGDFSFVKRNMNRGGCLSRCAREWYCAGRAVVQSRSAWIRPSGPRLHTHTHTLPQPSIILPLQLHWHTQGDSLPGDGNGWSHVTCHMSHVTCHMSHVTNFTDLSMTVTPNKGPCQLCYLPFFETTVVPPTLSAQVII